MMAESSSSGVIRLSVVVPMYNESGALSRLGETWKASFDPGDSELLLVDDGSTDDTLEIARTLAGKLEGVRVVTHGHNRGKGAAVRTGVSAARGEAILFMDADLSTDISCVPRFLELLDQSDAVIGSRSLSGSTTSGSTPLRIAMGRIFSLVARVVGGVGVTDSQCGFKMFRGDVARTVFPMAVLDRFAFDVEILRIMRLLDLRVLEVPVTWTAGEKSSVQPVRDSIRSLVDVIIMRARLSRRRIVASAATPGSTSVTESEPVRQSSSPGADSRADHV